MLKNRVNNICVILSIFCAANINAQQLPSSSLISWSRYIENPAFTGHENYNIIRASSRFQWLGFNGANTNILSGHGIIGKAGFGGSVFTDGMNNGNYKLSGGQLNYSYFIQTDRTSGLSLGISSYLANYTFDGMDLSPGIYDPALNTRVSQFVYDFNLGAMYKFSDLFFVGISANQILQTKLNEFNDLSQDKYYNKLARHFNFYTSYKYYLNRSLGFEGFANLRTILSAPLSLEVGARMISNDKISFGLGYRLSDAALIYWSFDFKRFQFNYVIDVNVSDISDFASGGQELSIGFKLGRARVPRR